MAVNALTTLQYVCQWFQSRLAADVTDMTEDLGRPASVMMVSARGLKRQLLYVKTDTIPICGNGMQ